MLNIDHPLMKAAAVIANIWSDAEQVRRFRQTKGGQQAGIAKWIMVSPTIVRDTQRDCVFALQQIGEAIILYDDASLFEQFLELLKHDGITI